MPDQATELRKLAMGWSREEPLVAPPPRLVVLTGGKGGVGTTTLAVNLSAALIEQGARVVLVDADVHRADVSTLCGIRDPLGVADVLAARRDIHEVLVRGPVGLQIVPGVWAPGTPAEYSEKTQYRLLRQLKTLGRHADWIVLDVGHGSPRTLRRFWQAADDVILVTTPDSVAVMDTYATVKTLLGEEPRPAFHLIVNRAGDVRQADSVHARIDQSCQRFLGVPVHNLGSVADDESVRTSAAAGRLLMTYSPTSPAAVTLPQVATRLLDFAQLHPALTWERSA